MNAYSVENARKLRALAAEGKLVGDIARELDVSTDVVRGWAAKGGVKITPWRKASRPDQRTDPNLIGKPADAARSRA